MEDAEIKSKINKERQITVPSWIIHEAQKSEKTGNLHYLIPLIKARYCTNLRGGVYKKNRSNRNGCPKTNSDKNKTIYLRCQHKTVKDQMNLKETAIEYIEKKIIDLARTCKSKK